jgi:acyl-CoA thioesterase-1
MTYVALGDSTAVGVGAREGGYPDRLARMLRKSGAVHFINLGQSGATSSDVAEGQVHRVQALNPQLVTLAIGVNDLWRMVAPERFQAHLQTIAKELGSLSAHVFVNNLPDLSHAPVASLATQLLGLTPAVLGEYIGQFNSYFEVFRTYPNTTLVDTYTSSQKHLPGRRDLFSSDGFHPSDAGYEQWAQMLFAELEKARLVPAA